MFVFEILLVAIPLLFCRLVTKIIQLFVVDALTNNFPGAIFNKSISPDLCEGLRRWI
jgi:hypothetical protein